MSSKFYDSNSIFDALNEAFSTFDSVFYGEPGTCKTNPSILSTAVTGKTLPWDLLIDDTTKNLIFKFALSGINQDNVSLEFENDAMILRVKAPEETKSDIRYIHRGIKRSAFTERFLVPLSKYNHGEAKATFKDGMLTVIIPPVATAQAKTVPINKE